MPEEIPGCLSDFILLVVIEFLFAENIELIIAGRGYIFINTC